ncbi:NAD(P)/FAD-dependent oxidoreductase [Aureitalea marina]|uniref:Pyridine nucleotide-disulfide oxidoreductase n=1 Tax=Aureitalea marina TaxID=930804 RepID=A0A2S7KLR8_9FLAO|nr:FAD/NAD(P)-binding oxidoreductase [Aureitalea marina]PQB03530.1 pyridine nucleotide-disulfide oxidoreductase [Aureitalea marina]
MKSHYQVLIIGGGTAGIMTAAQLKRKERSLTIAIIDPAEYHYYQPAWTLVGAGTYDYEKTKKPMKELIPDGVDWVQDYATGFTPTENGVQTRASGRINYEYLVVAPGLVVDTSLCEGLTEALKKDNVCSIYTDPEKTWDVISKFKKGNAVFTQPTTPIKCGGAPQKIAYLASDHFRRSGVKKDINTVFATPGSVIFGVKPIRDTLTKVLDRYDIHFKPFYAPFKIDSDNQIIYFKHTAQGENKCVIYEDNELGESLSGEAIIEMPYDMLHLAPPQAAPEFIRNSDLSNEAGWLDVDKHSLQHNKYENIFGLGDVAALPTAKTGAAIRKPVPVVVDNILKLIASKAKGNKSYDGYSSCPLVTGYGKMVLAEFDYGGNFTPDPKLKQMLVFDSSKEHWRLWMLKKYGLPYLYWNKMMKGKEV